MDIFRLSPWIEKRLEAQFKIMRVVWGFLLATPLILAFVLFNQPLGAPKVPADQIFQQPFVLITIVLSVLLIAAGGFIERRLLSPQAMSKFRGRQLTADFLRSLRAPKSHAPLYREEDIQAILALPPAEQEILGMMGPYFSARVIRHAFCESCATLGFMTAFQMGHVSVYIPYAVAAFVGIAMSMPKREDIEKLHKNIRL